jgi:hypothetical protein
MHTEPLELWVTQQPAGCFVYEGKLYLGHLQT